MQRFRIDHAMNFTDFKFIFIFLPVVMFFYGFFQNRELKIYFLIFFSFLFYFIGANFNALTILCISIVLNYFLGSLISKNKSRIIISTGILLNLGPLLYFKYSGFVLENLGFGNLEAHYLLKNSIIPLAISFYTFQQIGYLIDCYRNDCYEKRFINYCHFVSFFPQLINGPIMRYGEMKWQMQTLRIDKTLAVQGWLYFVFGFIKKFFIADSLGSIASPLFGIFDDFTCQQSIVATTAYTFQIYFDFSGYTDMAVGIGAILGYRIPINFNSPYKANSFREFWRRWHITLSTWLRDYIYIPLGGNREGNLRQYLNIITTMLLCGLWHGAGWNFVLWGGGHGLALIINNWYSRKFTHLKNRTLGIIVTISVVSLLWVPFRAKNLEQSIEIYKGFLNFQGWEWHAHYIWLITALILIMLPNSHKIIAHVLRGFPTINLYFRRFQIRFALYSLLGFFILIFLMYSFYSHQLDLYLYRKLPIVTSIIGINNQKGDFRSNLYINEVFQGDEDKIIVAGSSFTAGSGCFTFKQKETFYRSGTIGIGGNDIINGLRSAMAASNIPGVKIIILGVSALNMRPIRQTEPFKKQGLEGIKLLGFPISQDKFSNVQPIQVDIEDLLSMAFNFSSERYYQFHNFLEKIKHLNIYKKSSCHEIDFSSKYNKNFLEELSCTIKNARENTTPVKDPENGSENRFNWLRRGCIEAVQEGGEVFTALENLNRYLGSRDIRLIIYDTPTPTNDKAPHIYPKGFLEEYRETMRGSMKKLSIEYYDLIDLFPWSGDFMWDFIHPRRKYRESIHKLILIKALDDETVL